MHLCDLCALLRGKVTLKGKPSLQVNRPSVNVPSGNPLQREYTKSRSAPLLSHPARWIQTWVDSHWADLKVGLADTNSHLNMGGIEKAQIHWVGSHLGGLMPRGLMRVRLIRRS